MSFNSFAFIYFFTAVYLAYRFLHHRGQNTLLLGASLFFYGYWDWRFLGLMLATVSIDFFCAKGIFALVGLRHQWARRLLLFISIASNLTALGFFKYANFFSESLAELSEKIGWTLHAPTLNILLPVGISFYTFQAIAYVVDVFRGRIKAENNWFDFALFISFFPQLVAGPIERAKHLLPQVKAPRTISGDQLLQGTGLLFYGYFKKLVVADNLAPFIRSVGSGVGNLNGPSLYLLMLAMIVFIYADFSGYSNIARGLGKLMGFELSVNFRQALFANSPQDFWRRWHITLTAWFRDYVFWPLYKMGGKKKRATIYGAFCVFITFALCGLWHGAAWNFVFFGVYHGALLLLFHAVHSGLRLISKDVFSSLQHAKIWRFMRHVLAFHLLSFAAVIFFIPSPSEWAVVLWRFAHPTWGETLSLLPSTLLLTTTPLLCIDYFIEKKGADSVLGLQKPYAVALSMGLFVLILLCGATEANEFVYFQF